MKRLIFLFLFILFLGFNFSYIINAQTPTPKQNLFSIPGVNCGDAEDTNKNQCCRVYYPSSFIPPDLGPLNSLVNTFSFFTNFAKDNFLQPILDVYGELVHKNITSCFTGIQSTPDPNDPNCKCINPISPSPSYLSALNDFCQRQSKPEERTKCLNCANGGGVWSGMGCVYTDTKKFIEDTVFKLGIGLAGGFALLCIIYAAFMIQSSQGNPEKLKKAQELITSCIMGLMLIIFSVFILRLIGVNILKIPGFS
ncbi:MAG: hypothetical protein V1803_00395 [Candidatus Roizmanbacteria bacterium]